MSLSVAVVAYNPIASSSNATVRLPVASTAVRVHNRLGEIVPSQITANPAQVNPDAAPFTLTFLAQVIWRTALSHTRTHTLSLPLFCRRLSLFCLCLSLSLSESLSLFSFSLSLVFSHLSLYLSLFAPLSIFLFFLSSRFSVSSSVSNALLFKSEHR